MAISRECVDYFRGIEVPKDTIKTQRDLYEWALVTFRDDRPLANYELTFKLRMTRHGGILFNLRQDNWIIETLGGGKDSKYRLIATPKEELKLFTK